MNERVANRNLQSPDIDLDDYIGEDKEGKPELDAYRLAGKINYEADRLGTPRRKVLFDFLDQHHEEIDPRQRLYIADRLHSDSRNDIGFSLIWHYHIERGDLLPDSPPELINKVLKPYIEIFSDRLGESRSRFIFEDIELIMGCPSKTLTYIPREEDG